MIIPKALPSAQKSSSPLQGFFPFCAAQGEAVKAEGADLESCPHIFSSVYSGKWTHKHLATLLISCLLWQCNTVAFQKTPRISYTCTIHFLVTDLHGCCEGFGCTLAASVSSCHAAKATFDFFITSPMHVWRWAEGNSLGSVVCSLLAHREIYLIVLHHQVARLSRCCKTPLDPGLLH